MSQPVKLSDGLVLDARLMGEIERRSIAGQVEYWARLGKAIEPLLEGAQAVALQRSGNVTPLSALLDSVDGPEGRRRVSDHLERMPFPHYEPDPETPGLLIRVERDGSRAAGRFVNRRFVAAD